MRLESQIQDPTDMRVRVKPLCQGHRVLAMLPHPQAQRLQPLQEEKRAKRVETRSDLTEVLVSHPGCKRTCAKGLDELEPVVAHTRICHGGELARLGPVEVASIDDDPGDGGSVAADPLGCAMDNDVSA